MKNSTIIWALLSLTAVVAILNRVIIPLLNAKNDNKVIAGATIAFVIFVAIVVGLNHLIKERK